MTAPRFDAIFFDLGMVLLTFDWEIAIPRFVAHGASPERVRAFLADPRHEAFERDEITSQDFYQFGVETTGFVGTPQEFQTCWNEIFAPLETNVALALELASRYPAYVISNTNPWHMDYVEQTYPWLGTFRERIYSVRVKIRKPDTRIYEIALARAGVAAERALFLDDRLENIHGAQAVGMQTIHVPTPNIAAREMSGLVSHAISSRI